MTTATRPLNATAARRVYDAFSQDAAQERRLAQLIGSTRVRAYDLRLRELVQQMGVNHPASLTDPAVLRQLARESEQVAADVIRNFNRDLRAAVTRLAADAPNERALRGAVRSWALDRGQWKSRQIAKTEAGEGRNQAERDVISRNFFVTQVRAVPEQAQCPQCKDLVARGWLRPDQVRETPPLHPGCQHSYQEADNLKSQAQNKLRVWAGSWGGTKPSAESTPQLSEALQGTRGGSDFRTSFEESRNRTATQQLSDGGG